MSAWTSERPTKAGAYWNRTTFWDLQIVVVEADGLGHLHVNCEGDTNLEHYTGEWQPVIGPED